MVSLILLNIYSLHHPKALAKLVSRDDNGDVGLNTHTVFFIRLHPFLAANLVVRQPLE